MKTIKYTFKTIAIMAIVFGCSNNSATSQEEERQHLAELKLEIEQLVSEGTCSNEKECDFIAFGSKPCGGPWRYLVYPATIDVDLLKIKVADYNKKETAYNKKWGIASDCMMVAPPFKMECVDGSCKAVN
jgi:hypothetical protein